MVTHVATLLKGLSARGVRSAVLGPPQSLSHLRGVLERLGAGDACSAWMTAPLGDGWRPADDARAVGALVRAAGLWGPALVHAHGLKASVLAAAALTCCRQAAPALVSSVHGPPPMRRGLGPARWESLLARWALGRASAVVVVSRSLAEELGRWVGQGLEARKVAVIPNGLDPAWMARQPVGGPGRRGSGRRVVATCMARLTRVKGVQVLLYAAALLEPGLPLRIWVVGDGPDRTRLARLARGLGLAGRVRLLGFQADPQRIWDRSHIAVVPSEAEGFSYAALEAMAAGLPVVAFAVGGLVELLEGGCGELVPPGRPEALARALSRLAQQPLLRQELGRRARQRALESYSADRMVEATLAVYRQVRVGGQAGPRLRAGAGPKVGTGRQAGAGCESEAGHQAGAGGGAAPGPQAEAGV